MPLVSSEVREAKTSVHCQLFLSNYTHIKNQSVLYSALILCLYFWQSVCFFVKSLNLEIAHKIKISNHFMG